MLPVAASALAGAESEVEEVEELLSALEVTEFFSAVVVEGSEGVVGRVEGGPGCASGGVALRDAGVASAPGSAHAGAGGALAGGGAAAAAAAALPLGLCSLDAEGAPPPVVAFCPAPAPAPAPVPVPAPAPTAAVSPKLVDFALPHCGTGLLVPLASVPAAAGLVGTPGITPEPQAEGFFSGGGGAAKGLLDVDVAAATILGASPNCRPFPTCVPFSWPSFFVVLLLHCLLAGEDGFEYCLPLPAPPPPSVVLCF